MQVYTNYYKRPFNKYFVLKLIYTSINHAEGGTNMYDVIAIGELLIDFTPAGASSGGGVLFEQNPGGAPCNVLAMLARLGMKTAFIGKVGDDMFGRFLKEAVEKAGIDPRGLTATKEANTTLAFVQLDSHGDRSFSFYRNPGADMLLGINDVDAKLVEDTKVFHFGSLSMTNEPARSATIKAVAHAKDKKIIVSFDPNLRPLLWKNLASAKKAILQGLAFTDILKVSEEEMEFMTDIRDLKEGSQWIHSRYGTAVILVTMGDQGCFYRAGEITGHVPAFEVSASDTTGAGDAFLGAFLYSMLSGGWCPRNAEKPFIADAVRFANAAGAITVTGRGAIPSMPDMDAIQRILNKQ